MKAISIQRPWPEAIMRREKPIECRNWATKYRGRILIHVALKPWALYLFNESYYEVSGALIGTVELVRIKEYYGKNSFFNDTQLHLIPMGNHTKFGWFLKNPIRFKEPIPYRGQLGLFEVPDEIVEKPVNNSDLCIERTK